MAARYRSGYHVSGGVERSRTQKPWRPGTPSPGFSPHPSEDRENWPFSELTRSVAKLDQNTDRPNRNRSADSYESALSSYCRDDPDDASTDNTEKNEIGEKSYCSCGLRQIKDASADMG
jgi:hypothetical protein